MLKSKQKAHFIYLFVRRFGKRRLEKGTERVVKYNKNNIVQKTGEDIDPAENSIFFHLVCNVLLLCAVCTHAYYTAADFD